MPARGQGHVRLGDGGTVEFTRCAVTGATLGHRWMGLPSIDGQQVGQAILTVSWKTAVGQSKLHPRASWFDWDMVLHALDMLFMQRETLL